MDVYGKAIFEIELLLMPLRNPVMLIFSCMKIVLALSFDRKMLHPSQFHHGYVYGAGKLHCPGAQECLGDTVALLNTRGRDGAHQTRGPAFYTIP